MLLPTSALAPGVPGVFASHNDFIFINLWWFSVAMSLVFIACFYRCWGGVG